MNNITQIYKNTIKISIKRNVSNLTDTIVDAIVDSIGNEDNSYVSIVASVQEKEREAICMIIKNTFEEMDRTYKNSAERYKYYVINKSNVPRTITMIFGNITYSRCYYKSRIDGTCHFLLDEMLGLPKGDRYDPIVKAYAIDTYTKTNQKLSGEITGKQIATISNLFNNNSIYNIPRQSIHNWINNWNEPNIEYEQRETPKVLYIMVDEKYIGCQDKDGDIMVKSFVAFEDIERVSKNRNKLKNRLIFNAQSDQPWVKFTDLLYKVYDASKLETIYVLSDGGNWITANVSELKVEPHIVIKRLLCEVHFKQSINRITTDKEERKNLIKAFNEKSKNDFLELLDNYKEKYANRADNIEKNKTYISNNYNAIKDMLAFHIGSSMESHISHIVANPFSSRPKGYSSIKIDKYLKINDYVNNSINIFKLYLSSYNNVLEDESEDKQEVSTTTLKYADYVCHPPILDNKVNGTRSAINDLCCA